MVRIWWRWLFGVSESEKMKTLLMHGWTPIAAPTDIYWQSPSGITQYSLSGAWYQHQQGYLRHGTLIQAELKPGQWRRDERD